MKKQAFTLIELLVVITVIVLLIAVAMPSMQKAKEQARQVYCKNNLKQMLSAAYLYTSSRDDYFPIAYYKQTVESVPIAGTVSDNPVLCVVDPPTVTQTIQYTYCWDFSIVTYSDRQETIPGILWEGDTTEKVQQCPSYKGQDNWSGSAYSGYNYNTSYIGHGQSERIASGYTGEVFVSDSSGETIVQSAKAHQIGNPARCFLFGDGHYAGGANKLMRSPVIWQGDSDWSLRTAGTQGFRHNGQTNTAWADGHVSSQKEYYTETHPKYKQQLDAYNQANKLKIGFISPDNRFYDLK